MDRIEQLRNFLATTPQDSFLQHALALEYIKINEDEKAEILFQEILTREPGYVGSWYHLARLQERKGENEAAIKTYEKGMEEAKTAGDKHAYNELMMARDENDAFE